MRPFKYFFALLSSLLVLGLQAQNTYSFVFHKDGKAVLVVPSNQVDSITFSVNDIEPDPEPVSPQPQVYDECPDSNHPHLIDLGLPSGVKWACCNVDATNPGEYGSHFAWGETEVKEFYSPGTYTVDGPNLGNSIKATNYDVAYVKWGTAWCIPSLADCQELVDNCTWTWEQYGDDGNYGIRVKGKNGNSIFLPAGGFPNWGGWNRVGSYGTYWTSTHAGGSQSHYFRFDSSFFETTSWDGEQYVGQSVRPVSYSNTTPAPDPEPDPQPEPTPDFPKEAIDLGLSVRWASMNVGAETSGDFGNYYCWGETEMRNYWDATLPSGLPICYSATEHDVATVEWGGLWRTPTVEDMEELVEKCTWKWWYADNGNMGYKVTGPNGNSIFLPAAGYVQTWGGLNDVGIVANYRIANDRPGGYCAVLIGDDASHAIDYAKQNAATWGLSVRPVYGAFNQIVTPREEREDLYNIYSEAHGENWNHNTNWPSCYLPYKWEGVVVDNEGHITELHMNDNNMDFRLLVRRLPYLRHLEISNNPSLGFLDIENTSIDTLIIENSLTGMWVDKIRYVKLNNFHTTTNGFTGKYVTLEIENASLTYDPHCRFRDAEIDTLNMRSVTIETEFKPQVNVLRLHNCSLTRDDNAWGAKVSNRFECIGTTIVSPIKYADFEPGCEIIFEDATVCVGNNTRKTLNCAFTNSVENWMKHVMGFE